jgi:hypothetical protein
VTDWWCGNPCAHGPHGKCDGVTAYEGAFFGEDDDPSLVVADRQNDWNDEHFAGSAHEGEMDRWHGR